MINNPPPEYSPAEEALQRSLMADLKALGGQDLEELQQARQARVLETRAKILALVVDFEHHLFNRCDFEPAIVARERLLAAIATLLQALP